MDTQLLLKTKLMRKLDAAQTHLARCNDPARRALMQQNIDEKQRQLRLLTTATGSAAGANGAGNLVPDKVAHCPPAADAPKSQPGHSSRLSNGARHWACACCRTGPRLSSKRAPLGSRERAAINHDIAEPFVFWQLILAVGLELGALAAVITAATRQTMLHVTLIVLLILVALLRRDRCAAVRCHRWSCVRWQFQVCAILNFAWRLDRACSDLPSPTEQGASLPGSTAILENVLAGGPNTYQKKPTNRVQIESLLECIHRLVQELETRGARPLVLDLGAGKALLTRVVYEALGRRVATVALDCRDGGAGRDQFYDPPPPIEDRRAASQNPAAAPYLRVVADVGNDRQFNARMKAPLALTSPHGLVAVSKHLCGGATDCIIRQLCCDPLADFVGACCIAPCCHQKIRRKQYCNLAYLRGKGFCTEHVGLRGGTHDVDFRTLCMQVTRTGPASFTAGGTWRLTSCVRVFACLQAGSDEQVWLRLGEHERLSARLGVSKKPVVAAVGFSAGSRPWEEGAQVVRRRPA